MQQYEGIANEQPWEDAKNSKPELTFDGAGGDPFDDIALSKKVKGQNREDGQYQHCHQTAEIDGTEGALHRKLDGDGNGFVLITEDEILKILSATIKPYRLRRNEILNVFVRS